MLLLTGATGRVGAELLPLLLARGEPVRCLVRDPRRLGADRVRVQLALGDLADPGTFRHALRGVRTIVHLAASWRDQPKGSIEELDGMAVLQLVLAAEQAGVERFALLSPLGARTQHPLRAFRAKAHAEAAVQVAGLQATILRTSVIHGRAERGVPLLAGSADEPVQPIAAADVAACVLAALDRPGIHELAGPQTMRWRTYARRITGHRPLRVPPQLLAPALRGYETLAGPGARLTWEEARRMTVDMTTPGGTRDAEALGVTPRPLTGR